MNTSDAAKKLGVSTKTVQRWVKHLQLPASRNELGHYFFTDDDIAVLEDVKEQLKNGTPMQDVTVNRPKKGSWSKGMMPISRTPRNTSAKPSKKRCSAFCGMNSLNGNCSRKNRRTRKKAGAESG